MLGCPINHLRWWIQIGGSRDSCWLRSERPLNKTTERQEAVQKPELQRYYLNAMQDWDPKVEYLNRKDS